IDLAAGPDRRLEPIGVRFGHALQAVEREERAGGGAERDEGVAGAGYAQLQAVASRLSNEPGDRSLARRRGQPLRAAGDAAGPVAPEGCFRHRGTSSTVERWSGAGGRPGWLG